MSDFETIYDQQVKALMNKMWQQVAVAKNISVDDAKGKFEMRTLWAEDFDSVDESDYSYDWSSNGDQETFKMLPINQFESVGIYGFANGNCGATVNHIEIWIGTNKVREFAGFTLPAEMNDKLLFLDPVAIKKSDKFKVVVNTTGASATSKAFPMGLVIV